MRSLFPDGLSLALQLVEDGTLRVDEDGSVWRCRVNDKAVKPRRIDLPDYKGYRRIGIPYRRRILGVRVHRLVIALTDGWFPATEQVDHLNEDKGDNRRCNLERVSQSTNMLRSYAHGRTRKIGPPRKYDRAEVRRLRDNGFSYPEIAARIGCSISTAHRIVVGGREVGE